MSKHGGYGTRLYRIWTAMKARCYNPNREAYKNYGGRGIFVCEEWQDDFAKFRQWANSKGYREDLTIERVDNDDCYCPSNCCWITRGQQTYNRRPLPSLSGYYGVKFVKRNINRPWVATYLKKHLGSFSTPLEAHLAVEREQSE